MLSLRYREILDGFTLLPILFLFLIFFSVSVYYFYNQKKTINNILNKKKLKKNKHLNLQNEVISNNQNKDLKDITTDSDSDLKDITTESSR